MRKIPQGAGLYLAVLELVFALGWTVYVIGLPRLPPASPFGVVICILLVAKGKEDISQLVSCNPDLKLPYENVAEIDFRCISANQAQRMLQEPCQPQSIAQY